MSLSKMILLGGAALTSMTPALAQAQQDAAPAVNDAIIVTAQKRSESVQDVPAAVTAISGADLTKQGVVEISQLDKIVPSVKFTALRQNANIYVRGVGQTLNAANGDPAVATNLNGVYIPSEMVGASIFDIERIEVLPGPQGTLYGRNAAGGVINLVSRRPGKDFGADAFLEVGNFSRIHAFAGIDVPVSDTLRTRTAINVVTHDGYFDNGAGDQNTKAVRFSVEYTPTERTTVRGVIGFNRDTGIGPANQNNPALTDDGWHLPFDAREYGMHVDYKTWMGNLEIAHDLTDNLTLSYIGGYGKIDGSYKINVQLGPPMAFSFGDVAIDNYTNELRLNGEWDKVNAVVGAYQYYTDTEQLGALERGTTVIATGPYHQKAKGYAAFGQISYAVIDALRLTAGARISWDEKDFTGENSTAVDGTVVSRLPFQGKKDWTRFDWKLGAEADIGPASMVYGSIQTGYNQGGFSTAPAELVGTNASVFRPMTLLAYTLGTKNELFNGAVVLNVEGFYYDYKDYQVSSRSPVTAQNEVFNAEKATIYGVDIQTRFRPTRNDQLGIAVSLLHGEFDRLRTPTGAFDGNELPFAPEITVSAQYSHRFDLDGGATVEPWVQLSHTGKQWSKFDHVPGTRNEDYTLLDATLTYTAPDARWSASLWGRNLTNSFSHALLLAPAMPGPGTGTLRPPRTYGVRLSANF